MTQPKKTQPTHHKKLAHPKSSSHLTDNAHTAKKSSKDTIYVDADDDITSLIGQITASSAVVVALVLPKKSTLLQSIVNAKLVRRGAKKSDKQVVLVTSDPSVRTIAGVAELPVARTTTSKPEIPRVSLADAGAEDQHNAVVSLGGDEPKPSPVAEPPAPEEEIAEEDSGAKDDPADEKEPTEKVAVAKAAESKPAKKEKEYKVPDFGSFRLRAFAVFGGFALVVFLLIMAFIVMPKATVVLTTRTSNLEVSGPVSLNTTNSAQVSIDKKSIPGSVVSTENKSEEKVSATGKKDVGEKATGKIRIVNCSASTYSVAAGDLFSSDGLNFEATSGGSVSQSSYSNTPSGFVCDENGEALISVRSTESGTASNLSARGYSIAGSPDNITATGSDMSGGTTKEITVVSAEDIEKAKSAVNDSGKAEALNELKKQLQGEGKIPIESSLQVDSSGPKLSAKAGDEVDAITATQTVKYKLYGYDQGELNQILEAYINDEIKDRPDQKNISNSGVDSVRFSSIKAGDNSLSATITTIATIGPSFDYEQLQQQFAGKPRGEIIDTAEKIDGVNSVEVNYSPMWVTTTPKSAKKIVIEEIQE